MQSSPEVARRFAIPEWKIAERQRAVADKSRFQGLVRAAQAGVPIVFGTDAGSPAVGHDVVVPEMKFMADLGVVHGAYGAIRSATIEAARLSQLADRIGTLTQGKQADVIVVRGNPLDDLDALSDVALTFVGGKLMHANA